MKTESIYWSKNFEIFKYVSEHFGESVRLEEGDTVEEAQRFAEINVLKRLHAKHPHLVEVYPLPKEPKEKWVSKPLPSVKGGCTMEKVITIQRGDKLIEAIKSCTDILILESYEMFLDSDAAEVAYKEQYQKLKSRQLNTTTV